MWAITELSLRRMREYSFYILVLVGMAVSMLSDAADPITGQVSQGSLFAYALSGEAVDIPSITVGTGVAMLFCILISVFYSASEIPSDIANGLIMIILSKPAGRLQYLLGKYIATMLMSFTIFILIEITLIIANRLFGLGATQYTFRVICRQFVPALMLIPLITMTIAFSTVGGSMGAMLFTTIYSLFSFAVGFIPLTVALFPEGMFPGMGVIMGFVHYMFPNFLYYFQDSVNSPLLLTALFFYTIAISYIFMFFTMFRLKRMDLSISA